MAVEPMGRNARTALLHFAGVDDVDMQVEGWERLAIVSANEFFFVPKGPAALADSEKRIESAYAQFKAHGTVPEWMLQALDCLFNQLTRQASAAHESPPP